MSRVLVAGGYGVFGSQLARELADAGIPLTIAGRDAGKAGRSAKILGDANRGLALDVRNPASCLKAVAGHTVVANCAGPFSEQGSALLEACLKHRAHYVDIADDRAYIAHLRALGPRFESEGLAAAYGCSSLPAISGALALELPQGKTAPREIRVTLFIGNRNPKGSAAIASLFKILGAPISTAEGTLSGFGDRERVRLPAPWGEREVYNFESPEYDLFPKHLGISKVRVKVGFELNVVNRGLAFLSGLSEPLRKTLQRPLSLAGNFLNGWGHSGGAVQVERRDEDGTVKQASLSSPKDGQRMAILPAVAVVKALLKDWKPAWAGAKTAYEILGAKALLDLLAAENFCLKITSIPNIPAK